MRNYRMQIQIIKRAYLKKKRAYLLLNNIVNVKK